jgi:hypothetical protein
VRLEHPGLVRQGLAQDAEQGLELVPVHGVADEHQPLAAQPRQEVRRVEPTDIVRESANVLGIGTHGCEAMMNATLLGGGFVGVHRELLSSGEVEQSTQTNAKDRVRCF